MTVATKCSVALVFLNIFLTIGCTSRLYSEVDITVPLEGTSYAASYEGTYARYIHSVEAVSGILVLANEDFGCPSKNSTPVSMPTPPYILLLKLTSCSDYEQSLLAQTLGASGVVFYSASGQLSSVATNGDLSITVTLVTIENSVLTDLKRLPASAKPIVVISPLQRSLHASPHFYFIVVSIVALAAIFGSWLLVTVARRWWANTRRARLREQVRRNRESVIKRLVTRTYTTTQPADDLSEHPICAVCLESFRHPDVIRVLECNHEFHQKCVDPWLKLKMTCPLCKYSLAPMEGGGDPHEVTESEERSRRHREVDELAILPIII